MSGLKDSVTQATTGVEQAQSTLHQGMAKTMQTAQTMMAFNQGNFEAMTRSSQILATGMQDIVQQLASSSKASLGEIMSVAKAMASVKSVREAMELQSGLMRSTMETTVSQIGQLTDATMKLSERTLTPITARLSVATETFGSTF